jgi:galactoside O-acetyltransferase
LEQSGFAALGQDVLVSRLAAVHDPAGVRLGSHVRVDDFALITGSPEHEVVLGDHVHVAAHAAIYGGGGVVVEDYVTVSGRASVYSLSDDYAGAVMTNPTVPEDLTGVLRAPVVLRRHVVLGAGTIVLPGVVIEEGTVTGAMTLVRRSLPGWGVYVGVPARLLRPRSRGLLALAEELLERESGR